MANKHGFIKGVKLLVSSNGKKDIAKILKITKTGKEANSLRAIGN
jgi:hypothetical protein